jgi:hypothetical protein
MFRPRPYFLLVLHSTQNSLSLPQGDATDKTGLPGSENKKANLKTKD